MRLSPVSRHLARIKPLFLVGTCGALYGLGSSCGNMEVQSAVLSSLNQLLVGLIDALFLGLQSGAMQTPAPVAAMIDALGPLSGMLG